MFVQMPSQEIHINNSNITIKVSSIDIIISESQILATFYTPCKQCWYLWELLTDRLTHTYTLTHIYTQNVSLWWNPVYTKVYFSNLLAVALN